MKKVTEEQLRLQLGRSLCEVARGRVKTLRNEILEYWELLNDMVAYVSNGHSGFHDKIAYRSKR